MQPSKYTILIVLGLTALIALIWFGVQHFYSPKSTPEEQSNQPIAGNPVEPVNDFYRDWLTARLSTTTDPFTTGLADAPVLTATAKTALQAAQADFQATQTDPVLCNAGPFESRRTKTIFQTGTTAKVMVYSRDDSLRAVSVVTLVAETGSWKIDQISCDVSETAPVVGEFTFDRVGFLLKDSVQPPLDPSRWYLVYEDDGLQGFTAVLNFNDGTECNLPNQAQDQPCDLTTLYEAMPAHVQGTLTEAGVEVAHLRTN